MDSTVCVLIGKLPGAMRQRHDGSASTDQVEFVHAQFPLERPVAHVRLLFKEDHLLAGGCHGTAQPAVRRVTLVAWLVMKEAAN